jgi:2-polyprenyl-6-methoxyphenol hydroxylase-like FAD-dependent oxidoreductase
VIESLHRVTGRKRRALVIGGSLGGMIAAHLLRAIGWEAIVLERESAALESRGAGLGTHPALLDILSRIGLDPHDTIGVEVKRVICLDCEGRLLLDRPARRKMAAWGQLYSALRQRLPSGAYRSGRSLERFEQDGSGVTAIFTDGDRERGDLLVAADGFRSTVRRQLLPGLAPTYAGYVAWRVMLDERDVPADVRAQVFDCYTFCLPEGEQLLGYPVPGRKNETREGHRAYNIVWYRPVANGETLDDLCTDATGRTHPLGIPPPLLRPDVIAAIKAAARCILAPPIAEIVAVSQPFFQPIFDLETPRMASGRVVLMGDAAFVVRPHLGAGVTKAALDAAALADALAATDDIEAATARYHLQQSALGSGMVALARREGGYLGTPPPKQERTLPPRQGRDIDRLISAHEMLREEVKQLIVESRARVAAG